MLQNTLSIYLLLLHTLATWETASCNRVIKDLIQDYDKDTRPNFESGEPVNVSVQMYINSLDSINEINMEFKVKMYLRLYWNDPRLAYGSKYGRDVLNVDGNLYKEFWSPDPFFVNEKSGSFHKLTKENHMLKIKPDGNVTSSMRISITLSCPMYLHDFPLDDQACPMELESFAYDETDLQLFWIQEHPVEINEDIGDYDLVPEFDLDKTTYTKGQYNYTVGNYPFLRVTFHFTRRFGYYFFSVYAPSFVVVVLSWIAFWIDLKAVPARICIGFLTILTTITQSAGVRNSLPRVSYVKAVDIWMITCLLLVSVALVEYAIAHSILISYTGIKTLPWRRKNKESEDNPSSSGDPATRARRCDEISRFIFPLVFLVFNIVYWIYFTSGERANPIKSRLH